jgi:hypothetical protein
MNEREIAKKLEKGGVLAQVGFEVIGNPKDHVENTIRDFVANIEKEPGVFVLNKEFGDAEEMDGGLFGTFADTEILVDNLEKLNWLCVNFMPASIEIIAPAELKFSDKDLTLWFNDLLAKLHEVTMNYRQLSTKEEAFVKNMNAIIHNSVLLAAEHYHSAGEIGRKIGVPEEQVMPFLEANVKNRKLEKKGDKYYIK